MTSILAQLTVDEEVLKDIIRCERFNVERCIERYFEILDVYGETAISNDLKSERPGINDSASETDKYGDKNGECSSSEPVEEILNSSDVKDDEILLKENQDSHSATLNEPRNDIQSEERYDSAASSNVPSIENVPQDSRTTEFRSENAQLKDVPGEKACVVHKTITQECRGEVEIVAECSFEKDFKEEREQVDRAIMESNRIESNRMSEKTDKLDIPDISTNSFSSHNNDEIPRHDIGDQSVSIAIDEMNNFMGIFEGLIDSVDLKIFWNKSCQESLMNNSKSVGDKSNANIDICTITNRAVSMAVESLDEQEMEWNETFENENKSDFEDKDEDLNGGDEQHNIDEDIQFYDEFENDITKNNGSKINNYKEENDNNMSDITNKKCKNDVSDDNDRHDENKNDKSNQDTSTTNNDTVNYEIIVTVRNGTTYYTRREVPTTVVKNDKIDDEDVNAVTSKKTETEKEKEKEKEDNKNEDIKNKICDLSTCHSSNNNIDIKVDRNSDNRFNNKIYNPNTNIQSNNNMNKNFNKKNSYKNDSYFHNVNKNRYSAELHVKKDNCNLSRSANSGIKNTDTSSNLFDVIQMDDDDTNDKNDNDDNDENSNNDNNRNDDNKKTHLNNSTGFNEIIDISNDIGNNNDESNYNKMGNDNYDFEYDENVDFELIESILKLDEISFKKNENLKNLSTQEVLVQMLKNILGDIDTKYSDDFLNHALSLWDFNVDNTVEFLLSEDVCDVFLMEFNKLHLNGSQRNDLDYNSSYAKILRTPTMNGSNNSDSTNNSYPGTNFPDRKDDTKSRNKKEENENNGNLNIQEFLVHQISGTENISFPPIHSNENNSNEHENKDKNKNKNKVKMSRKTAVLNGHRNEFELYDDDNFNPWLVSEIQDNIQNDKPTKSNFENNVYKNDYEFDPYLTAENKIRIHNLRIAKTKSLQWRLVASKESAKMKESLLSQSTQKNLPKVLFENRKFFHFISSLISFLYF